MALAESLGYTRILRFDRFPCEVYFHETKHITLALGRVQDWVWVKGSKHFYIRAMEKIGDSALHSRLQEISKFLDYLKQSLPEFHCTAYYVSHITPRIALNSFRGLPRLEKIVAEEEELRRKLGEENLDDQTILDQLALVKAVEPGETSATYLESLIRDKQKAKDRFQKLQAEIQGASSILNEWLEKGYGIALVWNLSTQIHVTGETNLQDEVRGVEEELSKLETLSVRSRAHQQGLWIEEVQEPAYVYYAELVGLFHPATVRLYKQIPILQAFADSIEEMFNARLASPITREAGYREESSTAVAESLAAFLRQVEVVDHIPSKLQSRLVQRAYTKPVYFGLLGVSQGDRLQKTSTLFMIEQDELTRHVLITGTTGSGKTRVGQIIAETTSIHIPTIIIDPVGEFTGLIRRNPSVEAEFKLAKGRAYDHAKIYTLDDAGIQLQANILSKPDVAEEHLVQIADETALVLTELVEDERFRDIFRSIILETWKQGGELDFDKFLEAARSRGRDRKIVSKLDRLYRYRLLMSATTFSTEQMLRDKLSIILLTSPLYDPSAKLVFTWFVLRSILNHFLAQAHSEELKALIVVDEVHRYYEPGSPKGAAIALESIVRQGRAKGLGVVMITQSIKDLPEALSQANIRILMRISEAEIQAYGAKFGLDIARALHTATPRAGYVFYQNEAFWCRFRPTLSLPQGLSDFDEIRAHSSADKSIVEFKRQVVASPDTAETPPPPSETQPSPSSVSVVRELTDDEDRCVEVLRAMGGHAKSESEIQKKLGIGREKIVRLIGSLERKHRIKKTRVGNRAVIKLLD
jgi:hypothetical protein